MTDEPPRHLSGDQLVALKFAAHRQLARWAKKRRLEPRQREQRAALVNAVRILEDRELVDGCELRPAGERET